MDIKSLFDKKKEYLDFFFENVDIKKTQKILDILINCKNNIIFTGIGKSSFIANKIANTMLSTGTKAIFLPPIDALHGDIAIVNENDIFMVFSKSGETNELLDLIPFVKKRKAKVIAVVSKINSSLEKISDETIYLPLKKELCPFNLAPTTSTCTQLIFGDILTIALMENKKFSISTYAINHPKGAIGKQIYLKVRDLMVKGEDLPICENDLTIKDILNELSSKKCGCVLITDNKRQLKGIFTDGDLRRLIEKKDSLFLNEKIENVMTTSFISTKSDTLAVEALKLMEEKVQITVLPVIENNQLLGLLKMHDVIQAGLKSL
ncbi:MAG: Arabinose 5-phosphate isomerase KdsD [Candidatus Anoxychlamydiales bacterium]|nr:Arabinose 5-phosphate isomerase KdsD [Candidatus Anoxychlamydiales bacterium]